MPRPRGRSPIVVAASWSSPVVMKRSSEPPDSSITPSAAYRAFASLAAVSTTFWRSASSESSELNAMLASNSSRRRASLPGVVSTPPRVLAPHGSWPCAWCCSRAGGGPPPRGVPPPGGGRPGGWVCPRGGGGGGGAPPPPHRLSADDLGCPLHRLLSAGELVIVDDEHRTGSVVQHVGRDAAVDQSADAIPAVGADHDQPCVVIARGIADRVPALAFECERGAGDAVADSPLLDRRQHVVHVVELRLPQLGCDLREPVVAAVHRRCVMGDAGDGQW